MATYEYDDKIKFILPTGYIFSRETDDNGEEFGRILAGKYVDGEGDTCYNFNCKVSYYRIDPQQCDKKITDENLFEVISDRLEPCKKVDFFGKPSVMLLNKATPLSFFGNIIKTFMLVGFIQLADLTFLRLFITRAVNEENPAADAELYDNLCDVLKAIRVSGKKLPVDNISSSKLREALEVTFDENGEAVMDISPKVRFNFTAGEETTTYEYTSEGMKEISQEGFRRVYPDERLYPHYSSLRSEAGSAIPGVTVVVNAGGMEYTFLPFHDVVDNDDADEEIRELYRRVIAKDTEKYDLHEKAKKMQKLFHVTASVFDPQHDRECELEEGLMHRAYMMSGLRSFAWTLADYCKEHDCTPDDVDRKTASRIVSFIANEDWLNYDGDTYCKGLCTGSDLHVYFIPDEVSQADRKKLLPSKEDIERVRQMKDNFPAYSEILSEVHSLHDLRKDLEYIYPAVQQLWEKLAEERNYNEALLGNEADIVYAWCILALAAKEPFFSEDGPMRCCFSQLDGGEIPNKNAIPKVSGIEVSTQDCEIDFLDTFTAYNGNEKEIILPDGITGIGEDAFLCNENITSVVIPEGVETIEAGAFWMCYNLKTVVLPSTLRSIGENAFNSCEELTRIVIPDGCEEIGADAFTGCKKLKDIYVPDSVYDIGDDAFFTFNDDTVIHTLKGSTADSFAEENGWKVDYNLAQEEKMPFEKTLSVSTTKSTRPSTGNAAPEVGGVEISKQDCVIDFLDNLTVYNGNEKEIILPDGITGIGEDAFSCNGNITSVVIPEGVETIETGAFWGCNKLKNVRLPSTLRSIGENAFYGCKELTRIVIPDGCEEIGADAFTSCKKLKDIYVPDSVYDIGDDAFYTFSDETVIHTLKGSTADSFAEEKGWKVDYNLAQEENMTFERTFSVSTTKSTRPSTENTAPEVGGIEISRQDCEIDFLDNFTAYNGNEKDIILPDGITGIGKDAFLCNKNITSVVIPEGVETIEDGAFWMCHNLKAVVLPSTLRSIGENAFNSCEELTRIVIPDECEEIGAEAFSGCKKLKEIILPDGITGIGEDMFYCNENITSVVIPEGVETIEAGAFWGCNKLKNVILPSTLRSIGENAFNSCEELTRIVIPDGCEEIGADAFTCCKKLKDIYVPDSVYDIGDDAFCTFNDDTVIHTLKDSTADSFAEENGWKVDYDFAPIEG